MSFSLDFFINKKIKGKSYAWQSDSQVLKYLEKQLVPIDLIIVIVIPTMENQ